MDSFKRFSEEKLPDKMFLQICKRRKIWNKLNMNIGDYRDHYLKKDVLLLADVFEKFIDTCLNLVSAIFYQIFILPPNVSPLKTMKNVFHFI